MEASFEFFVRVGLRSESVKMGRIRTMGTVKKGEHGERDQKIAKTGAGMEGRMEEHGAYNVINI